jgi:hypothetical protein
VLRLDEDETMSSEALQASVTRLIDLSSQSNPEAIVQLLNELVPGATVMSTPPPDLTAIV